MSEEEAPKPAAAEVAGAAGVAGVAGAAGAAGAAADKHSDMLKPGTRKLCWSKRDEYFACLETNG